jgi:predicted nucleotidyltransferase
MAYSIQEKLPPLAALCARYGVRRLALFGSALREDFDPEHSDLDFLVEFQPLAAGTYSHAYFGLLRDLELLFGRSVDLVEAGSIRNPYVLHSVEAEQKTLYAA